MPETDDSAQREGLTTAANWLLAAQGIVIGIFGTLEIKGELVGRMANNHPVLLSFAVGFAIVAVLCGLLTHVKGSLQQWLPWSGAVALLVGVIFALAASAFFYEDQDRPTLRAVLNDASGRLTVTGNVRADHLESEDYVFLQVGPWTERSSPITSPPDLRVSIGSDSNGKVDQDFSTSVRGVTGAEFVLIQAWIGKALHCSKAEDAQSCVKRETAQHRHLPSPYCRFALGGYAPTACIIVRRPDS